MHSILRSTLTALFLAAALAPSTAAASPWTLPADDLLLSAAWDFQFADEEFLIGDGEKQAFPLDGEFVSNSLRLDMRYGFTDRFEGEVEASFKTVTYESDPVILGLEEGAGLAEARAAITDFSQTVYGAADIFLSGRYNLLRGPLLVTNEVEVKFPMGYTPPQRTFEGDDPTSTVADDVALGDGQADISEALLFGAYIARTRTFLRMDLGFRLRTGDPGHQAFGEFKIGQFLGDTVVIFAGTSGAYTVTEGEVIGQSFITRQPEQEAAEFDPSTVDAVDLRLDRDFLNLGGGILFVFDQAEVQVAYNQIVVGENIPAIHAVSIGTAIRLPEVTGR